MISLPNFKNAFLKNVNSQDFAAEPLSMPNTQSPAAKELQKKGVHAAFSDDFLLSVHALLGEYFRLVREQDVVRAVTRKNSRTIVKLGNAIQTLQAVSKRLKTVEVNTQELVGWEVWARIQQALEGCETSIRSIREHWMSQLHPTERDFLFPQVKWEPVLKAYDYDLKTLKKKAPEQWLYTELNSKLARELEAFKLSDMTRYRIISSLLAPFGLSVMPITLKQYFSAEKGVAKARLENPAPSLPEDELENYPENLPFEDSDD